jgi:hypothetical protein
VREDGRIVDGGVWQDKVHKRGIEEASKSGKESSHSACVNGIYE